jgi:hypothetical protein
MSTRDESGIFSGIRLPSKASDQEPEPRPRILTELVRHAELMGGVHREDLHCGDRLIVRTRNSCYIIYSLGDGRYRVSGGWFDRSGASPVTTTINGCTFGGSAIKTDLIAGRGLFLEFGNHVLTTRIQQVQVIRAEDPSVVH